MYIILQEHLCLVSQVYLECHYKCGELSWQSALTVTNKRIINRDTRTDSCVNR